MWWVIDNTINNAHVIHEMSQIGARGHNKMTTLEFWWALYREMKDQTSGRDNRRAANQQRRRGDARVRHTMVSRQKPRRCAVCHGRHPGRPYKLPVGSRNQVACITACSECDVHLCGPTSGHKKRRLEKGVSCFDFWHANLREASRLGPRKRIRRE